MIIGDVLLGVSIAIALALTGWALILGCALIFPSRVQIAESRTVERPWKSLGIGALLFVLAGGIATNVSKIQLPIAKVFATGLAMAVLGIAVIGAAGMAMLAARRLRNMDAGPSEFQSLKMSTWIIVLASSVPVLGWFLIGPLALLVSLGAGFQALTARVRPVAFEAPPTAQ